MIITHIYIVSKKAIISSYNIYFRSFRSKLSGHSAAQKIKHLRKFISGFIGSQILNFEISIRREMGGTLVVAESGWGGGFKLSKLTNKKSHLGSNIPFYLLIYWYFLASMLKLQLLLSFCHKSVCVRLWLRGGGGLPSTPLCKHIQCHIICLYVLVLEVCQMDSSLYFHPKIDWTLFNIQRAVLRLYS